LRKVFGGNKEVKPLVKYIPAFLKGVKLIKSVGGIFPWKDAPFATQTLSMD
jgi:hypothetical protein